jgi:hypothetical protein
MGKKIFSLTVCMIISVFAFSEEPNLLSAGIGMEGNKNTRDGAALGESIGVDYSFNIDMETFTLSLDAGIKTYFSQNFDGIVTFEPLAFIRWYPLQPGIFNFFVQAGAGAALIREDTDTMERSAAVFLGEGAAGLRWSIGNFFVDAYARGGYPFMWGAGLAGGYKFDLSKRRDREVIQ